MNLLDKVKKNQKIVQRRAHTHKGGDEVAIAWLNDEVGISAITRALGMKHGMNTYTFLSINLREAFRQGKLIIKK